MEPAPWETLSLHHDERAVCDDPRRTFEVIRGEWKLNDIVEQGQELPHLLQDFLRLLDSAKVDIRFVLGCAGRPNFLINLHKMRMTAMTMEAHVKDVLGHNCRVIALTTPKGVQFFPGLRTKGEKDSLLQRHAVRAREAMDMEDDWWSTLYNPTYDATGARDGWHAILLDTAVQKRRSRTRYTRVEYKYSDAKRLELSSQTEHEVNGGGEPLPSSPTATERPSPASSFSGAHQPSTAALTDRLKRYLKTIPLTPPEDRALSDSRVSSRGVRRRLTSMGRKLGEKCERGKQRGKEFVKAGRDICGFVGDERHDESTDGYLIKSCERDIGGVQVEVDGASPGDDSEADADEYAELPDRPCSALIPWGPGVEQIFDRACEERGLKRKSTCGDECSDDEGKNIRSSCLDFYDFVIKRFQAYARIIDDVTTLFESVPNGGAFPSSEGQEPLGTMSEGEAQDEAGVPKTFYEDSRRSIGTGLSGVCCGDTALHDVVRYLSKGMSANFSGKAFLAESVANLCVSDWGIEEDTENSEP